MMPMYEEFKTKSATAVNKYLVIAVCATSGTGFAVDVDEIVKGSLEPDTNYSILLSEQKINHLKQQLDLLADRWLQETVVISSITEKIVHPDYMRIIGVGEPAIPFLLDALENKSGLWFPALISITGENPSTPDMAGNNSLMKEAWLDWGRVNGYI